MLKGLRMRLRMTQHEFATLVGVRQPQVARSEREGHICDIEYLQRVAKATGKKLILHYGR